MSTVLILGELYPPFNYIHDYENYFVIDKNEEMIVFKRKEKKSNLSNIE